MKATISQDRRTLTITADAGERANLAEFGDEIHSDRLMCDMLEHITCNSELEWIPEGTTGDLTSAPMLGILGEPEWRDSHRDNDGTILAGADYRRAAKCVSVQPVVERWAFMSYQVRSVLQDLRDCGEAVFVSGN